MTDVTMGNQQEVKDISLSVAEVAWLAGMFNGDGCFSLTFRLREKCLKCDISLTITQCDPSVIEKALILFERMGASGHIVEYPPSGAGVSTKYNLRLSKMAQIAFVLQGIIPYMVGSKAAQARMLLRYILHRAPISSPSERTKNKIQDDAVGISIAKGFYSAAKREIPKDVLKFLNDHPVREYAQVGGSAQHH